MAMRSNNSPRRIYLRAGNPIVCLAGAYFGPKANTETAVNTDKEVTLEVLDSVGGRKRVQVTQRVGKNKTVEVWTEKTLTFVPRATA